MPNPSVPAGPSRQQPVTATHTSRRIPLIALGLWLVTAAIFMLSSSGRIDTIDGQFKFATTYSLVVHGDVLVRDPAILSLMGNPENPVSSYPLGSAITGLIPVALGIFASPDSVELAQFLWCLTTALVASLIAPTLFLAWQSLGFSLKSSVIWTCVACFSTLIWPLAASCFDQAQQGWLLLLAVVLAHRAVVTGESWPAVVGGAAFGLMLNIQSAYVLLLPPVLLACTDFRPSLTLEKRFGTALRFFIGAAPGMLLVAGYNYYRYGSPIAMGAVNFSDTKTPIFGSAWLGALVLTFSPGKGIFLYSPAIIVALLGFRSLLREHLKLALLIAAVTIPHFLIVARLSFPGGDWCWGPRYLVVTLPAMCLLLPYGARLLDGRIVMTLVVLSTVIQLLALSLDHQRFYYNHHLPATFWFEDPGFHLHHSQLVERVNELLDPHQPRTFTRFSSAPFGLLTYAPFGPPGWLVPRSDEWVQQFAVFYWPRPWPLWMSRLPDDFKFLNVGLWVSALGAMLLLGMALIRMNLDSEPAAAQARA